MLKCPVCKSKNIKTKKSGNPMTGEIWNVYHCCFKCGVMFRDIKTIKGAIKEAKKSGIIPNLMSEEIAIQRLFS